jgi:hypothetical protein
VEGYWGGGEPAAPSPSYSDGPSAVSDAPKPHAIDLPAKRPAPAAHQPAAIEMSPRDVARAQERQRQRDAEMITCHVMGGPSYDIPLYPRAAAPLPAPPRRSGPPAPAIGEHPHLQKLLGDALAKDPQAASDLRFRARLDKCLGLKSADLMSWGKADLDVLAAAADTQAQIAKRLGTIDAARIADECRTAATKPPSLIERMTKANKPAFFKQTLGTARTLLDELMREVVAAGRGCGRSSSRFASTSWRWRSLRPSSPTPWPRRPPPAGCGPW